MSHKADLLTWREKLQCFNASATSSNLEPLCLSLKMTCWIKDATTRSPCQCDLKQQSMLFKKKKASYGSLLFLLSDPPNGVQLLRAAGAAERAVSLTESSLQTWLQKLNSAYKRHTLLQ